ncbi:MAG: ribosome biogenesis GTP-binding protein YihA/YsxC [Gemmatimonadota bacterium]
MKIRSLEFAGTVVDPTAPLPSDLPQIAFAGRSNVGKSSLINTLLRRTRKAIARVSGEPGKTRAINFFRVNDAFFLVDLPGYGFARVPASVRESWKELVEGYLARKDGPQGVVQLIDARHEPTALDLEMMEYLAGLGVPAIVALTKVDKLKWSQRAARIKGLTDHLGVDASQIIPFSSKTGEGREELAEALLALLASEEVEGAE